MSRGDVGRTGSKDLFATVEARHGVRVLEPREIQPPYPGEVSEPTPRRALDDLVREGRLRAEVVAR